MGANWRSWALPIVVRLLWLVALELLKWAEKGLRARGIATAPPEDL